MNEASSIRQAGVAADKGIASNGCPVDFHSQGVYDHVLGGLVEFRVNEGHEIVASYHITKSAEPFFDSVYLDTLWQCISQCLKLTVSGTHGNYQSIFVSSA